MHAATSTTSTLSSQEAVLRELLVRYPKDGDEAEHPMPRRSGSTSMVCENSVLIQHTITEDGSRLLRYIDEHLLRGVPVEVIAAQVQFMMAAMSESLELHAALHRRQHQDRIREYELLQLGSMIERQRQQLHLQQRLHHAELEEVQQTSMRHIQSRDTTEVVQQQQQQQHRSPRSVHLRYRSDAPPPPRYTHDGASQRHVEGDRRRIYSPPVPSALAEERRRSDEFVGIRTSPPQPPQQQSDFHHHHHHVQDTRVVERQHNTQWIREEDEVANARPQRSPPRTRSAHTHVADSTTKQLYRSPATPEHRHRLQRGTSPPFSSSPPRARISPLRPCCSPQADADAMTSSTPARSQHRPRGSTCATPRDRFSFMQSTSSTDRRVALVQRDVAAMAEEKRQKAEAQRPTRRTLCASTLPPAHGTRSSSLRAMAIAKRWKGVENTTPAYHAPRARSSAPSSATSVRSSKLATSQIHAPPRTSAVEVSSGQMSSFHGTGMIANTTPIRSQGAPLTDSSLLSSITPPRPERTTTTTNNNSHTTRNNNATNKTIDTTTANNASTRNTTNNIRTHATPSSTREVAATGDALRTATDAFFRRQHRRHADPVQPTSPALQYFLELSQQKLKESEQVLIRTPPRTSRAERVVELSPLVDISPSTDDGNDNTQAPAHSSQ